jgi:hypothetical protein
MSPLPHWLILGLTLLVQSVVFFRWLYRRMRDDENQRAFVRDVATNHLPHLYHALRLIAARLNIELRDPPPVRLPDENNSLHRYR